MLLSFLWIRELCAFPQSAEQAARALTARGLTVDATRSEGDDVIFDVDVPANRPDCLGHLGIARELSAAFGVPLAPPQAPARGAGGSVGDALRVQIDAPELCGRYTARLVRGVTVGASPAWVTQRLAACGLHSINNVVDVSNLVLLHTGHPIHTFDFAKVREGILRVRRARSGESLESLDGAQRSLDPDMLVIADATHVTALAGVIGGRESQIVPETRDVLIEAAWFLPRSIRATARRLGLHTDASHRFERGVDPEGVVAAQDLAVRWLAELAGGSPMEGTIDARGQAPDPAPPLRFRAERVRLLLGYEPSRVEIEDALTALRIPHSQSDASGVLAVSAPSWRVDLEREADLVEEVARHLGYDRIPARLPLVGAATAPRQEAHEAMERSRDLLSQLGFHEAFCYSMTGAGEDDPFVPAGSPGALELANPLAAPMGSLRRSLLAGLVRAADLNLRRGTRDVRLFEVGGVFLARQPGELPYEPLRVGVVWTGSARPRHWSGTVPEVGLPEIAGIVETILESVAEGARLHREEPDAAGMLAGFQPGSGAQWRASQASGPPVAWAGALHPDVSAALGIDAPLYLAEVDLDRLLALPRHASSFRPLPRVPSTSRDLSLVLPRSLPFARIREVLESVPSPAPVEWEVTDRYEGAPLAADEVSLTVRGILQPLDRTLTDAETESYRGELVQALRRERGIRLRE